MKANRNAPGCVRDAIVKSFSLSARSLSVREIEQKVFELIGETPASSIRSYLRLNTPTLFIRESRGRYKVRNLELWGAATASTKGTSWCAPYTLGNATLHHHECFAWISQQDDLSFHAVVTDPPYGLHEYTPDQQEKRRSGRGGVWRVPPTFDGHQRSPLPRFTTLSTSQLDDLYRYFLAWAQLLLPKLVPGANVVVASNPLLSYLVSRALAEAGLERRGEIIRLTMTLRGGDRPKAAHEEFRDVSVMPRAMWEPWLVYRRPLEGRVQDNLRKWGTGGFRRPKSERPFGDVIASSPTHQAERRLAPHPSLKPQAFLRQLVRAVLPLGKGIILDPFAGAGSTLAAAQAVGYGSVGVEVDEAFFLMATESIPALAAYEPGGGSGVL